MPRVSDDILDPFSRWRSPQLLWHEALSLVAGVQLSQCCGEGTERVKCVSGHGSRSGGDDGCAEHDDIRNRGKGAQLVDRKDCTVVKHVVIAP